MSIATITSKGQITLPKDVRKKLNLKAGEKVDFRVDEISRTVTMLPLNKKVDDVFGCLRSKYNGKTISIEEMDRKLTEKLRKDFN